MQDERQGLGKKKSVSDFEFNVREGQITRVYNRAGIASFCK